VAGALFLPPMLPGLLPAGETKPVPKAAPIAYLEIDHSFTANLVDTGRFLQIRIAVSTLGGEPVLQAVERHRLAIIAAVLGVLGETGEADVVRPGGREALAKRMRAAINDVLQRKSGIAGIDEVFIVTFVLQ
jgi:flagellar basal body-associated protein FliL